MRPPITDWTLIDAMFLQGTSIAEIAKFTKVREGTIHRHITRKGLRQRKREFVQAQGQPVAKVTITQRAGPTDDGGADLKTNSHKVRKGLGEDLVKAVESLPSVPFSAHPAMLKTRQEAVLRIADAASATFGWDRTPNGPPLVSIELLASVRADSFGPSPAFDLPDAPIEQLPQPQDASPAA